RRQSPLAPTTPPLPASADTAVPAGSAQRTETTALQVNALTLSKSFEEYYDSSAHPQNLLGNNEFQAGVANLAAPDVQLEQVINYCLGANERLAALAAEALARRTDSVPAVVRVASHLHNSNVWIAFFVLRFLQA